MKHFWYFCCLAFLLFSCLKSENATEEFQLFQGNFLILWIEALQNQFKFIISFSCPFNSVFNKSTFTPVAFFLLSFREVRQRKFLQLYKGTHYLLFSMYLSNCLLYSYLLMYFMSNFYLVLLGILIKEKQIYIRFKYSQ